MNNPYNSAARTITQDRNKMVDSKIDYLLSSVRPFGQDPSYDEHQRKALTSWAAVARCIVLFNIPEDLSGFSVPGLVFVGPDSNPPTIKQMLLWLQNKLPDQVAAIANSDIILTPDASKIPLMALKNSLGRAWACTSFRQTLDPATGLISEPSDLGLDLFCSTVRIWNDVVQKIPGVLKLGRPVWDNWLNSFLHTYIDKSKYIDLTPWKCVIHPKHEVHFRFEGNGDNSVQEAVKTITHPGGLPPRRLPIP